MRSKDGQPLKLKLIYGPNTSKQREQIAVIAQQAYAEVGVEVALQGMEWARLPAGAPDPAVRLGPPRRRLGRRRSSRTGWSRSGRRQSIPQLNSVAYVNKRVEELFDQGSKEFDREKRKKIYQEIQSILSTDAPYVFLVYSLGWTFLNKRLAPERADPARHQLRPPQVVGRVTDGCRW